MRAWVGVAVVALAGCPSPQAGCNVENCRAMLDACRVEFSGSLSGLALVTCVSGSDRPTGPVDLSKYCVDACNARPGRGELASCIAGRADACRAARDAGLASEPAFDSCLTASPEIRPPVKSCDNTCLADRDACDTKCGGGRACDNCLRAGGSCASVCTSTNYAACLDCGAKCSLDYLACNDRCPREP